MLTVYGIETAHNACTLASNFSVATVLTVYGIETQYCCHYYYHYFFVATVLTVYGIETFNAISNVDIPFMRVATVLTVYGIETFSGDRLVLQFYRCNSAYRLRY